MCVCVCVCLERKVFNMQPQARIALMLMSLMGLGVILYLLWKQVSSTSTSTQHQSEPTECNRTVNGYTVHPHKNVPSAGDTIGEARATFEQARADCDRTPECMAFASDHRLKRTGTAAMVDAPGVCLMTKINNCPERCVSNPDLYMPNALVPPRCKRLL